MGRWPVLAVTTTVGLTLAACGSSASEDDSTVADSAAAPSGSFVSTSDVQEERIAFSTPVTVRIEGSQIGWQARCNSAGVKSAEVTSDQLIIGDEKIRFDCDGL